MHGGLLIGVGNLNQSGLIEGASANLKGGWGAQSGVQPLQPARVMSSKKKGKTGQGNRQGQGRAELYSALGSGICCW